MVTPIQKLFTDNKPLANGATFVGEKNRLWYNPSTGFRVSDGKTPGGLPAVIAVSTASIGDLVIASSNISTLNSNENLNLISNGTGSVAVVGSFSIQTPASQGGQQVLAISNSGNSTFTSPTITGSDVAFEITGNAAGTSLSPTNPGGMLEITGQPNLPNRIYIDGQNSYPVLIGRRYNGTTAAPTAVLNTQTILRIGANPWTSGGAFTSTGTARIDFVTLEAPTPTNQGSSIQLYTTPIGSNQPQASMIVSSSGIYNSANLVPLTDGGSSLGDSTHRWGSLYLGKGALFIADQTTNANTQITVNSGTFYINGVQNLVLGQLTFLGNTIQSSATNANINIGNVNDTGLFTVSRQTYISTPNFASNTAVLTIDGVNSPNSLSDLTIPGNLIHAINQPGNNGGIALDTFGTGLWSVYSGRTARGTVSAPTAIKNNDIILSVRANGYDGSAWGTIPDTTRIDFVAAEDFATGKRGSQIDFYAVQTGTTTATMVAAVDYSGIRTVGITFSNDNTYQTTAGIPYNTVGISNGIAQLGSDGRLKASQIPTSLSGAVTFAGGWNASTNTPNLANNTSTYSTGTEFVITVSGTQNLGGGSVSYIVGGFIIYGGGVWNYTPSASVFISITATNHISVNTATGIIQVTSDGTPNNNNATLVARDGSGNFAANAITANAFNGPATSAGTAATVTGAAQPNITSVGILSNLQVTNTIVGTIQSANKLTTATTINGVAFDGSVPVTVHTAGSGISISGTTVTNTGVISTSTLMSNAVTAGYANTFNTTTQVTSSVTAGYANTFNTTTQVTSSVTANTSNKVANALTAGYGLTLSSGSTYDGSTAVTISSYEAVTGPVTVVGNAYALNLTTCTGIVVLDNGGASINITISNPIVGKIVRVLALGMAGATKNTVTGITAANSANGTNQYAVLGGNPTTAIIELICTTTATSGVYMNLTGAK